jgi:hypothetical protein
MTPLRQRMIEDMQSRASPQETRECCVAAFATLVQSTGESCRAALCF